jgi:hypothetical protein
MQNAEALNRPGRWARTVGPVIFSAPKARRSSRFVRVPEWSSSKYSKISRPAGSFPPWWMF